MRPDRPTNPGKPEAEDGAPGQREDEKAAEPHATEAGRALLSFAFEVAGMHRVYARCDARNAASARVMARLGMHEEAHLREHAHFKGRWDEELIFAILDRQWFGRDPR